MHIPAGELGGAICPITAAITICGIAATTFVVIKNKETASPARFVLTSVMIFILQMLNYPIGGGISGHVVGGILAVLLLGVPIGVMAVTSVLIVQALFLGDGGIPQLGANILNMAIIGTGLGGIILNRIRQHYGICVSAISTSIISVFLSVAFVATELMTDGSDINAGKLFLYHIPIAMTEGIATTCIYSLLTKGGVKRENVLYLSFIVLLLMMLPFSSSCPDALEAVLHHLS